MSSQLPLIAVPPPSHGLHAGDREGEGAPGSPDHVPAMHSPAAPVASRALVLLGLVLVGMLHLAILVAPSKPHRF